LKNKNLKNPLLLSVTYGLHAALMSMRLKERFHASPEAIMALHAKHRQQQRKKKSNVSLTPNPSPRRGELKKRLLTF